MGERLGASCKKPPDPQELSKFVYIHVRCGVEWYFFYNYPGGASVTVARNSKNAIAGPLSPLYGGKEGVLRGVAEL